MIKQDYFFSFNFFFSFFFSIIIIIFLSFYFTKTCELIWNFDKELSFQCFAMSLETRSDDIDLSGSIYFLKNK